MAEELWITVIGLVAGILTTSGYIPQIVKGYRTKKLDDVSYLMPAILGVGMSLWLIYGLLLWNIPLIASNSVACVFLATIIVMKRRYERNGAPPAQANQ